jgi:dolichol-phosphate mannosyltransferase
MSGVVWLVLPTYNEIENLEQIVAAAREQLERAVGDDFKILVVDDNSPDGTGAAADRLAASDPHVEVLHRGTKDGIGPAYIAGFAHALANGASLLMEMDADFSHDPADLPRLIAAAGDGGADLVLGSRYVAGGGVTDWGLLRRIISRGGSGYARVVLGLSIRDLTGGFKCFRSEVLEAIDFETVRAHGYAFQVEMTYRALKSGFRVVEIPIVFRDRQRGKSKMHWRIAAEAFWVLPQLRRPHSTRAPALSPPQHSR